MAKYVSNINADATRLSAAAGKGWWTVVTDPSKVAEGQTVLQEWTDLLTLMKGFSTDQKLEAVKALGLSNAELIALIKANAIAADTSLANLPIGNVEDDQRSRLRSALQLVDTNVTIKGILADDRSKIIYWNGSVYGVKRLLYSDVTSTNERSGYESSGIAKAISGTGSTLLNSSSNQWLTFNFSTRNVFSIKLRHTNNNWAARKLNINYAAKSLTSSSGTYTYSYLPVNGFQSVNRLQIVDDAPGNTEILDLQVLYSDSTAPTLTNGQQLTLGDLFRVDGSQQILEYLGVDTASGAWKAQASSNNINIDTALDPISTNALQNRVITAALDELRRTLGDRIDAIQVVDDLQSWIEKQLLFNAIVVNRVACLFDEVENLKKAGKP